MIPGTGLSQGGSSQKDARTLILMIVAALVLFVVLVGLFLFGNSGKDAKPRGGGPGLPEQAPDVPRVSWTGEGKEGIPASKLQIEQIEDPGDPDEEREPLKNEIKPFEVDPGWDEDVIDGDENLEPRAFYYLIHRAATMTEEELAQSSRRVDSTDIFRTPSSLRGRRVRIQGTLIALREKNLEENRSGVRTAYVGQMVDNHMNVLTFYLMELPEGVKHMDVIEVRGIFYKVWKYKNRENRFIESPLVIGRTARKIPKYIRGNAVFFLGNRAVTWLEIGVGLTLVLMIPIMFVIILAERRRYASFKKLQMEKRKAASKGTLVKPPKKDEPGPPPVESTPPGPSGDPAGKAAPETPEQADAPAGNGETPPPEDGGGALKPPDGDAPAPS